MINNVTIMGRLTAAPELKVTESGTSVLRLGNIRTARATRARRLRLWRTTSVFAGTKKQLRQRRSQNRRIHWTSSMTIHISIFDIASAPPRGGAGTGAQACIGYLKYTINRMFCQIYHASEGAHGGLVLDIIKSTISKY